MKAYKGFNADMTCRGFKFEVGKTYEESDAKMCARGFHACLDPLECFRYYPPSFSVYCEVDIEDNGEREKNSTKVVGRKITIVRKITPGEIARLHNSLCRSKRSTCSARDEFIPYTRNSSAFSAGNYSNLSAGNYSYLSAGYASSLSSSSDSFLSAHNSSSLSADKHSALLAGDDSTLSARSCSSLSAGNYSILSAGNGSVLSAGANSILTVLNGRCRAGMNSVIAIANRTPSGWIIGYAVGIVDGINLLPNVWYVNCGGKLVEWDGEDE